MKKKVQPKKAVKAKRKVAPKASEFYAQSKRLGFRLLTASDEKLFCELFTDAKTLEHVSPPLSAERAAQRFKRALESTAIKPLKQRITVIVERGTKKALGIASLRLIDADKRRAEAGMLLKPSAQAQRFAIEASKALISAAFRRHTIDEISAQVSVGHTAGEKLVAGSGYTRGDDIPASGALRARSSWTMTRESWADTFK